MTVAPQRPPAEQAPGDSAMDQALNWLIELDAADASQQARFEAWLRADPAHAEAFAQAEAIWNSQTVRQTAATLNQRPQRWQRLRAWTRPMAAAAVLLLGVGYFGNLPLRLQADHLTVAGERQRLELDDGSRVLLNTRSAFSSQFDEQHRLARLYQGEAFFEVANAHGMPLEIEAGPLRMSTRGSAMSVRYLDGEARVQVQRGAVDVHATKGGSRLSLGAGDSVSLGAAGLGPRESLEPGRDLAWVQGRLIFDNCPMGQVLDELRRYYPGLIVNTNPALGQVNVTGNYRLDNPLDVVRSLAEMTSASVHELPKLVIIN